MTDLEDRYETLFPYKEARASQVEGIHKIDEALRNDGIVTMEGACGTGKTLTALIPFLNEVRNSNSDVDRILAVTSVKQQMEAFQDEIKRINDSLSQNVRPISALTLVSIRDLHPYVKDDIIDTDDVYNQIDALREGTRELVNSEIYNYSYNELYQRAVDPQSGKYPYGGNIPEKDGIKYDPYYAKYRSEYDSDEDNVEEVLPFNPDESGVITADTLVEICRSAGFCPHSMMRLALEKVDVIIGNYMHAFDPKTVKKISGSVLDSNTVAIFDEAHNLVPKVRDYLSDQIPVTSLSKCKQEIEEILLLLDLSSYSREEVYNISNSIMGEKESESRLDEDQRGIRQRIKSVLSSSATITNNTQNIYDLSQSVKELFLDSQIDESDLIEFKKLVEELEDVLIDLVEQESSLKEGDSIRLRNPEEPEFDKISDWIRLQKYDNICKKADDIGKMVSISRDNISETSKKPNNSSSSVGDMMNDWYMLDNIKYYRSIEIKGRKKSTGYESEEWQRDLKAEISIKNCIPRNEIASKLDVFKSSVLMSATLEPLNVYHTTTGINKLENAGRSTYQCSFGLSFPKENRLTIGVTANKFKYSNRGSAFDSQGPKTDTPTREQYMNIIFDVIRETDGNLMIVMPSYTEAEWIGSLLENSYICKSDNVYIDQSSSNRETQNMKKSFFSSDNGVLVTGARGTLIEGVDYIGDKLKGVVVCGVPITNTNSDYKKAIQAAYNDILDDVDGFTLAFTIPAVRKARQAIGRVIRTKNDTGIRVLVDKRYASDKHWDSVYEYMSPSEQSEIERIPPEDVDMRLSAFWDVINRR